MKIVIFGIGGIYHGIQHCFLEGNAEIVALLDNSRQMLGTLVDGYSVDCPENIQRYQYDYIVITSNYAIEMRRQLVELGVCSRRIMHFLDYIGTLPAKAPVVQIDDLKPCVLILSNNFGYHGGPMVCVNLARVLRQKSYRVTIAVPGAEQEFVQELSLEEGIEVIVVENLDFLSIENLEWTSNYTYVLVNTFVMAQCAIKLAQKRKVYLWLHESIDTYAGYEYWHDEIRDGIENDQLIISAVSDAARKNFLTAYQTEKEIGILPYGIVDRYKRSDFCEENGITTFTVVAVHESLKGVDVLLDALHFIPEEAMSHCRFLFVGKARDNEYGRRIRNQIDENANCEYLGELSREKLFEAYSGTDIVIIPSRRDSLPLVATEAMMLKKPCIISDATGTARYIKHKINGLVFESENKEELAERICWCLKNKDSLKLIAENARKTYEEWFTMEKFGDRVAEAIERLK